MLVGALGHIPLHVLDRLLEVLVVVVPSDGGGGQGDDAARELDALALVGHLVEGPDDEAGRALPLVCGRPNGAFTYIQNIECIPPVEKFNDHRHAFTL